MLIYIRIVHLTRLIGHRQVLPDLDGEESRLAMLGREVLLGHQGGWTDPLVIHLRQVWMGMSSDYFNILARITTLYL